MSIYRDIQKVTQIPYSDETSTFVRHRESTISKRNRRINKPKLPRNANLYTEDDEKNDNEQKYDNSPQQLYKNEIASSIQEANCGINYSNQILEEQWKAKQIKANLNAAVKTGYNYNNTCSKVESIEDEEYLLKKYRLHKNAAIRGLLKNHKISLNDLQIPNKSDTIGEKEEAHVQHDSPLNNLMEGKYSMKLVQCPEEPEVFVTCEKLDENEYKDIDFTVPRLGKKKKVTPIQYYLNEDDSGFDFVKNNIKGKK
ncbi:uncharacterized protein LOC117219422 isoform X1 [Megalopta genalis]|uniref:uncharacterized protein LOC117219422 isoform X1 n=1 Tax=Megalopta genalis TaxID=115081 RepID=UPI003FD0E759